MTGYINPSVVAIPNPVGLDAAMEKARAILAELSWLEVVYGRAIAQHTEGERGTDIIFPEVWGVNREPENVMPNDNLTGYSFFIGRDPGSFTNYTPGDSQIFISQPVSLIVWVNLLKVDSSRNYRFSEVLKLELLNKMHKVGSFTFQALYESYSKVLEGFTITDTYRPFLKPPYWACRIDGLLSYTGLPENC